MPEISRRRMHDPGVYTSVLASDVFPLCGNILLCCYTALLLHVFVYICICIFTCICIHFVLLYPFCCYMETFFVSPMFSVFSVVPLCCYTETFLGHFALIRVFSTQFELFTSHKNDSGIKKSDNNATVIINHEIKLLSLNVLYFWHLVTEGGWPSP